LKSALTLLLLLTWITLPAQLDGPSSGIGSPSERLIPYLQTTPDVAVDTKSFDSFVAKLSNKNSNGTVTVEFLERIFYRVHQAYLKQYQDQTAFASLFQSGSYNCLSGTILFSIVLDHFSVPYEVIETNYHIFILAHVQGERILIETTDANRGFVTDTEQIEKRIEGYRQNQLLTSNSSLDYYRYNFNLFNRVQQHELTGLLYFNQAVEAFNRNEILLSIELLSKAGEQYNSPRITEFSDILILAVHESDMKPELKSSLKRTLQTIRYKALPAMASLDNF
jgi:hypothetical protein